MRGVERARRGEGREEGRVKNVRGERRQIEEMNDKKQWQDKEKRKATRKDERSEWRGHKEMIEGDRKGKKEGKER